MLSWNYLRYFSQNVQNSKKYFSGSHRCGLKRHVSDIIRMNTLFSKEKSRQKEKVGRIEKIDVTVHAPGHDVKLEMNKSLSTPYDCARHITEHVVETSALAFLNDVGPWDMHRPLEESCTIHLKSCLDSEPQVLNQAFWRTCSFLLASVAQRSFKDTVTVVPHSFPPPNVVSGSFVSYIHLSIDEWQPTELELRRLSKEMVTIAEEHHLLERLDVSQDVALEIFEGNQFKTDQIPSIASKSRGGKLTLYRAGDHIDISRGPMVSHTGLIGRCSVTAVQRCPEMGENIFRFQGVALFKQLYLNHFAFKILEERASKPNVSAVAN